MAKNDAGKPREYSDPEDVAPADPVVSYIGPIRADLSGGWSQFDRLRLHWGAKGAVSIGTLVAVMFCACNVTACA